MKQWDQNWPEFLPEEKSLQKNGAGDDCKFRHLKWNINKEKESENQISL